MKVDAALKLLRNSELKQLSIKDDVAAVIGFLNLGILELHKRFSLWQEEAIITQAADVFTYKLDGVDSNVDIDLSDHDLVVIRDLFTVPEDEDEEEKKLVLSDEEGTTSVYKPKFHTVKFNEVTAGDQIRCVYRASPIFLKNEKQDIPLPPQFMEALFNYVGYKGHSSVKTTEPTDENKYLKRFEVSVLRITQNGLVSIDDLTSTKFEDRGFV